MYSANYTAVTAFCIIYNQCDELANHKNLNNVEYKVEISTQVKSK